MTFTVEKLYQAYRDCISKKRRTVSALKFEIDREQNLFDLLDELKNRTYKISQHICFIIKEPTPREIFAADFRDRIIHHLLCNEISHMFEKDFIESSFANRKGKGTHKAVQSLREELRTNAFFLKLDIQAFFRSIDKEILYKILEKKIVSLKRDTVWRNDILWLCKTIINHNPVDNHIFHGPDLKYLIHPSKSLFYANDRGLPIGNLTSQFFGNVYLNELDQYISSLGFRHVRYVDDFVLFSRNKSDLIAVIPKIKDFLQSKLHLTLHPKKMILQDSKKGVDFLGYFVRPKYVLVRRRIVARLKKKIWGGNREILTLNSYLGHFLHANSYGLRKSICEAVSSAGSLKFDSGFRKFIS